MNQQEVHAELQDVVYNMGGNMELLRHASKRQVVIVDVQEVEPEVVLPPVEVIVHAEEVAAEPIVVVLPWYKRLWIILNTDVRVLWRQLRKR